ncbi:MFS transporter [Thiohalobacter sp. COW1]|uniref:MFS transporter n=1 Tax=Thiohalobacter sp. COW1 TaxID=2795687 RepID=UPI00351C7BA5
MADGPEQHANMTRGERRAAVSLAGIFAMRMLGLFMILPVFALYADDYTGATPGLIGLAIGAYGFTQALLQIPFGLLSDRFGRKRIIAIGLLLFALGSLVAALADSIWGVILGRALQGAGAIAAAVMALAADLTREEHRTKAMAVIGMSIGLSFALALVLGPWLGHWIGLSGIFWLTAVLALSGLVILRWSVPSPALSRPHRDAQPVPAQFLAVLRDARLLRLDFGILALHLILTASFVSLPLVLRDSLGLAPDRHAWLYLPVLVLSVAVMIPFIIQAEKQQRMKPVFLAAIVMVLAGELALVQWQGQLAGVVLALFVFYVGFNILEATLPSLISKTAPADSKGTAMGFYSSSQFLGAFLGGALGGVLHGRFGATGVFLGCALIALVWLAVAAGMERPRYLASRLVGVGRLTPPQAGMLARELGRVPGVVEAVVVAEDETAYLKVDPRALDEAALETLVGRPAPAGQ